MSEIHQSFYNSFATETVRSNQQFDEVAALRYAVLCIEKGYEDSDEFSDNREQDTFDLNASHGLVRDNASGRVIASVRLIKPGSAFSRGDFPMEGVALQNLGPAGRAALKGIPRGEIAEISRLTVSTTHRRRRGESSTTAGASDYAKYQDERRGERQAPLIHLGLLSFLVRESEVCGIEYWMGMFEPSLLRVLQSVGIEFEYVGEDVYSHGKRRPVLASVSSVLEGVKQTRPDIWRFITGESEVLAADLLARQA